MEVIAGFAGEPVTVLITLAVILISTLVHCLLRLRLRDRQLPEQQPVHLGPEGRGGCPPPLQPIPVQPPEGIGQPQRAAQLAPPPQRTHRAVRHEGLRDFRFAPGPKPPPVLNRAQHDLPPLVVPSEKVSTGTNTPYFEHLDHRELVGLCWDYNLPRSGNKVGLRAILSRFWWEDSGFTERNVSQRPWEPLCTDHVPIQNPWHPLWVGTTPWQTR